jgi:hypothetical protein
MLTQGKVLQFVNGELLPYLKGLRNKPNSTPRQKVISEILSGVERVRIDTQKNLCDVCDKVHGLSARHHRSQRPGSGRSPGRAAVAVSSLPPAPSRWRGWG